eukprot:scaffold313_cov104-Skeletonema_menzelii.AAC.1
MVIQINNAASVHRIAKNALVLSEKFGTSDQKICINYYLVAGHLEPYLSGSNHLRKGFASETYKNELAKKFLLCYRETVATLIDRGETTGIDAKLSYADAYDLGPGNKLLEVLYFQEVFRNYWLGYTERCHHYALKSLDISKQENFFIYNMKFYHGTPLLSNTLPFITTALNLLDMIKKKANYSKTLEVDEIIESMKIVASHAETNFRNKLELLEAEHYGLTARHESVVAFHAYNMAIVSAQKAGFLHEQGLACERAGFYCERMKYDEKALSYFNQALECYQKWGSSVKVEYVRKELDKLHA